ncbi:MAG TPA: sigma-70 family RNA polymerase sigma factor [Blastocatellia bacterium]|nr:sigma-70 family RNA polymerase sigma factor [Blastocatellia bacterium]
MTESTHHLSERTDEELVEACLSQNSAAWETLIKRYERLIYSVPVRLGMRPEEAVDIFQSVCFILVRKLPTLRNHERLYSWLITTTTRECWRIGAQKRRETNYSQALPEDFALGAGRDARTPEQVAYENCLAHEENEALRRAVQKLSEPCRNLLTTLYFVTEEPTYEDVARTLNIPVSSIGPTRARCLQKLRRILKRKP